jgi:hypothetical protein
MRLWLLRCFYFLLPLFVLAYPLDCAISHYVKKSETHTYGEYNVWNDIYSQKLQTDIAIYGSSRAWLHFDPRILSDSLHQTAYNFGIDGHNFWLQYFRHREFLKYNPPPKHIILSVDIYTLEKKAELYNSDQFLPYMLWDKDIKYFTAAYKGFSLPDYYLPLLRYYGKKKAINTAFAGFLNKNNANHTRIRGYQGQERVWSDDFEKAKTDRKSYHIKIDSTSQQLFETFLKECDRAKIKVTLVYAPEYIEGQNFVTNRADIIQLYHTFAAKYGVRFIDFSKDDICTHKQYFYNTLHLNKTGATIFSSRLAHLLK